ncbi:MAG: transcription antitermination factor NusB [Acetobacteraceae bacterium]|nr:transcription antitermination factor NusB [Acetobacteraceae bacterium]
MTGSGQQAQGKPRPRTGARVAAVQALFQSEQGPTSAETVIDEFIRFRFGVTEGSEGFEDGRVHEVDVRLFSAIVRAAVREQDRLDAMITDTLATDWKIDRLDPVLRALIRAGSAELAQKDGPPAKVVINEYLDVAHGFFEGDEPRMANGVLDRMAHLLRPSEFSAA